jgi:alpha-ketoglutarate-dependent taurine dioxygenase
VDKVYSQGIQGMTQEEAAPLLQFLSEHASRPDFTCRLRWQKNTFVMWDNRASIHFAFNDYDGYRREMFRTIVEGEIPC